jgi:transposase-like protein
MSVMLCPLCGGYTHRSHTRGFREKLVKGLTSHKTYRCHECGWRGWLRAGDSPNRRNLLRTIISVLLTLLITTLLALYVVDKLSGPKSSADFEQQQTP